MAGTHLAFTLLILAGLEDIQANLNPHGGMNAKPYLDPKRRSEIVDETFLEQKDILLEMLETKLKEVQNKRKKKTLAVYGNGTNSNIGLDTHEHDKHLENVDVKLMVNGISAIGDSNLELKYGTGKGLVQMDAQGISNIGKVHVELGVGETGLFIPGLTELFMDHSHLNATKNVNVTPNEAPTSLKTDNSRRSAIEANLNETTTKAATATHLLAETVTHKSHTIILEQATPVNNSTVQVWNTYASTGTEVLPLVIANTTVTVASNSSSTNTTV